MIKNCIWILLLNIVHSASWRVALYNQEPYISIQMSICSDIIKKLASDLEKNLTIIYVDSEDAAIACIKALNCDASIGRYNSELTLSYPLLIDTAVIITKDLRPHYIKDIFWQFLVLMASIWLPLLIILSHLNLIFEPKTFPYHQEIFRAIWAMFVPNDLKSPLSKIWAFITWIMLLFIFLLIIADLASIIASANLNDSSLSFVANQETCTSLFDFPMAQKDTAKNCLKAVKDNDFTSAILGKMELNRFSQEEMHELIIRDASSHLLFFHLILPNSLQTKDFDDKIKNYWNTFVIQQVASNYINFEYKSYSKFSLIYQEISIIFVGISILVIFLLIVILRHFMYKPTEKKNKDQRESKNSEASPSSRSLLARNPSHTLSLDQSVSNRYGTGRPEEWINKAVDIRDENAHKFKDIQDYENELSAVNPANPSNISDKSLLSLIKNSLHK
ncbi:hypothetical protein SteCoe_37710 [Stentor coeruleus]|uniref:Ionotropic glutamate receptor C-terminal domain-containing protein n=1 Tax=Stentor coeruleus TaxID=5963 RepID=A0A1R2AMI2_9CILI|nr:hypothetical protein SteCoe_37710 [Stentor coeruleus]